MSQQWYSIVEYAREFAVSDMTVRRRIKTGRLHAVLRDGKYFIPVDDRNREAQMNFNDETDLPGPSDKPSRPITHRPHSTTYETMQVAKATSTPLSSHQRQQTSRPITPAIPNKAPNFTPMSNATGMTSVDAQQLVDFCTTVVEKFGDLESRLESQFHAKEQSFRAAMRAKDLEMAQLKQQVEDLQLLVRILEKKS